MVTEFPVDNILIQGAFRFFAESSKRVMMDYAPIVFLIRVVMNMFSLKGAGDYLDLIKDTILMFVGIMMFREIMLLILNIPEEAQELIYSFGNPKGIDSQSEVVNTVLNSPMGFLGFSFNDIDLLLGEILKGIALIVYWAVYWFYFLFIFIAICLGSYVIFFASMFQMRWVLSVFLITVTIASLWPFLWYGTDYVLTYAISELAKEGSSAGILTSSIVTNLIKIVVPLGSFAWAMSNPVGRVTQVSSGIFNTTKIVSLPWSGLNQIRNVSNPKTNNSQYSKNGYSGNKRDSKQSQSTRREMHSQQLMVDLMGFHGSMNPQQWADFHYGRTTPSTVGSVRRSSETVTTNKSHRSSQALKETPKPLEPSFSKRIDSPISQLLPESKAPKPMGYILKESITQRTVSNKNVSSQPLARKENTKSKRRIDVDLPKTPPV